jgi:glycine oxidase
MSKTASTADVVIMGGGVSGCAVAYFLASDHHLRCTIVERDGVANHASGNAAGELSPIGRYRLPASVVQFGVEGLKLHRSLAPKLLEESGIDYQLTDTPILRPAFTETEMTALREQMAWQNDMGIECSWLDEQTLESLPTWLASECRGTLYTEEAQLETRLFALALAEAAQRNGVTISHGEVTGLLKFGSRASGVMMGEDSILAQAVVIASGPWSLYASDWLGSSVPVKPVKGQIIYLEPPMPMPDHAIFHDTGFVLPKPSGELLVGTTEEDTGFDTTTTQDAGGSIMEAVGRLAPMLASARIRRVTACLRAQSSDGLPIIGTAPGLDGVYMATGHYRKGILQSLVTGKYLAQLIAHGHTDYPLEPFSPQRFTASA